MCKTKPYVLFIILMTVQDPPSWSVLTCRNSKQSKHVRHIHILREGGSSHANEGHLLLMYPLPIKHITETQKKNGASDVRSIH